MLLKSYCHFKILTIKLTFIFFTETKRNKKEDQSFKVKALKSAELVTLADGEKIATSVQKRGKYTLNIQSRIRAEVGKYVLCCGTQPARKCFSSKYLQHELK